MSQDTFAQARELFLAGVASLDAGRLDQAERQFLESLQALPGRPSTLANLGAVRLRLGRPAEALEPLRESVQADAKQPETWAQLGEAYAGCGQPQQALPCYDQALAINPSLANGWLRRSHVLQVLDRLEESVASCERALALAPQFAEAWGHHGNLLKDLGRPAEAAESFRRALANGGDPELNGWFLASLTGAPAPAIAPAGYVQGLFDGYADEFESHLVRTLRYQGHAVLVRELQAAAPGRRFARALDLGCGTGLVAGLLRRPGEGAAALADAVDGVDLSQGMVDKARASGLYDAVAQGDVAGHLQALQPAPGRYDLLLAADVFIYVGALDAVFAGAREALAPGGLFAFTVEAAGPDEGGEGFCLRPSQRYAHTPAYLGALAELHGFELLREARAPLREDQRRPIAGLFQVLRRR